MPLRVGVLPMRPLQYHLPMLRRLLLLVALVATFAYGKELRVPADYRTIQGALDAAAGGDEIVVAAGTYHEILDTKGRKIVVRSSAGPAAVTVSASCVPARCPIFWRATLLTSQPARRHPTLAARA